MIGAFLAAAAAGLSAKLPELGSCEAHRGPVDRREIARLSRRAPAVLVACLGVGSATAAGDGRTDAALRLSAFVVASDRPGLARDRAALAIVEGVLAWLPGFHPGGGLGAGAPEQIRAENLFSGALDQTGAALWAVSWRQTLRLPASGADPGAAVPRELYAAFDPAPGDPAPGEPAPGESATDGGLTYERLTGEAAR